MKTGWIGCVLLCVSGLVNASQLYKVVRADGTVVYTDVPRPGAVPVTLGNSNSATIPALAAPAQPKAKRNVKALPDYQLRLLQPQTQQTLRNNAGNIKVQGQLTPQAAGEFLLFLDGQLVERQVKPDFMLENIVRGEHLIQLKFQQKSGKILASSPVTQVFLHRSRVGH